MIYRVVVGSMKRAGRLYAICNPFFTSRDSKFPHVSGITKYVFFSTVASCAYEAKMPKSNFSYINLCKKIHFVQTF